MRVLLFTLRQGADIHAGRAEAWYRTVSEALEKLDPTVELVRGRDALGRPPISSDILSTLDDYDKIIVDVTSNTRFPWFILGAALRSKASVVVTTSEGSLPPVVTVPVFVWDEEDLGTDAGVDRFAAGLSSIDSSAAPKAGARAFISYSHVDHKHLKRVLVHLRPLERDGRVVIWEDNRLQGGADWREEIEREISACSVAILLVSADFLASDFIVNEELFPILKGAQDRGLRVLSLILKPCRFARVPELRRFQAVNAPTEPLVSCSETRQEEILDELARQVEALT